MEGILTDVSDPNIVLKNITSREKYLSDKHSEKSREPTSTKKQLKHEELRKTTSGKNYDDLTRETFIDRMLEQPVERGVVSRVAKDLNINYRTALRWWYLYNETEEVAYKKSEQNVGRESSFTAAHNAHIYELIDNDPQLVSDDIIDSLTKNFEDFKISKSQLTNHLRNTMLITIKKPVSEAEVRNSAENLQTRYKWFIKWRDSDLDYTENCVFIDE